MRIKSRVSHASDYSDPTMPKQNISESRDIIALFNKNSEKYRQTD